MILEMDLDSLGVTKDDVANFVQAEFERADIDDSGTITFEEFVQYYNGLQDYLRDKLTNETKNHHVITKYREEYIEAKSLQALSTNVSLCHKRSAKRSSECALRRSS